MGSDGARKPAAICPVTGARIREKLGASLCSGLAIEEEPCYRGCNVSEASWWVYEGRQIADQ